MDRAARHDAASSVASIASAIAAPCVLASERAPRPLRRAPFRQSLLGALRVEGRAAAVEHAAAGSEKRAADDERAPRAARRSGDADAFEAVAEAVTRAACAGPRFRGRHRAPAPVRAGQMERRRSRPPVQPDAPVLVPRSHLEHGDAEPLADRDVRRELVVGRWVPGSRNLEVERAPRPGERSEPDLDPRVGAVRPTADAADPDPGGDVSRRDLRRGEGRQRGRDAVATPVAQAARVRVRAIAACSRSCRGARRRGRSGDDDDGERE